MIRSDRKISIILDNACVGAGSRVLDVACGTGVLTPDYLARDVASVTAVDISPEMIRRARDKLRMTGCSSSAAMWRRWTWAGTSMPWWSTTPFPIFPTRSGW